ncbi:MAG TPA: glycosyltransferase [Candidatus Kapabacteria bacterium]|nr:glycosyltransferase [Candidatus Kapabacteria bacterium]
MSSVQDNEHDIEREGDGSAAQRAAGFHPINAQSVHAADAAHGAAPVPAGRRRLLVIAYYYPPMGLSGVLRTAKFTRHLHNYGWDPTVLTVGDVGYFAHDYSLLEEVLEAGVAIERTKTLDPLRLFGRRGTIRMPADRRKRLMSGVTHLFLQPDNKIGWKRYAVERAVKLAGEEQFDAILATAPPFTGFLIGLELHKRLGLPLVVDYRDPWLDNSDYFFATPAHKGYAANLEEAVLKNSDAVVVINRRIKERLIARYPFLTHEGVHIIPSGFDPQDFRIAARYPLERSQKMRFTYSGLVDSRRTPKVFFQALASLFARHPEMRDEIEICFVGNFHPSFRKLAVKMGVASALVTPGNVEHHEKVRYLLSSDVLWLISHDPVVTPGKLYEYIGARKPILALAPEGALQSALAGYGPVTIVPPSDPDAVASAILALYGEWRANRLPAGNAEVAKEHDQRLLTERLARVLSHSVTI